MRGRGAGGRGGLKNYLGGDSMWEAKASPPSRTLSFSLSTSTGADTQIPFSSPLLFHLDIFLFSFPVYHHNMPLYKRKSNPVYRVKLHLPGVGLRRCGLSLLVLCKTVYSRPPFSVFHYLFYVLDVIRVPVHDTQCSVHGWQRHCVTEN